MDHVKRHTDITKTANLELDKDVDSGMMAGLTDEDKFARRQYHECYCPSTISETS